MYSITYTEEALADLAYLRKHERRLITDTVDRQLISEPTIETNNRTKQHNRLFFRGKEFQL